tara:strand:- start:153 stop:353 length:201 start_codon:yes stop_codon:yes gene_type:complete
VKGELRPHICTRHTGDYWVEGGYDDHRREAKRYRCSVCDVEFFFSSKREVCILCERKPSPDATGHP